MTPAALIRAQAKPAAITVRGELRPGEFEALANSIGSMRAAQEARVKKCYQLHASGESLNGWMFRMVSRAVFECREEAEAHIPEFSARCCDRSRLECADPDTLAVIVVEYEFVSCSR